MDDLFKELGEFPPDYSVLDDDVEDNEASSSVSLPITRVDPNKIALPKLREWNLKEFYKQYPIRGPNSQVSMLIFAPSGKGKTSKLYSMFMESWKDQFEYIFIFSPSAEGGQYDFFMKYPKKVQARAFTGIDEPTIRAVIKIQNERLLKHQKPLRVLFVIDDLVDKKDKNNEVIINLFVKARHKCISVVQLVQDIMMVHPNVRKQASIMMFLKGVIGKRMKHLYDEHLSLYTDEDIIGSDSERIIYKWWSHLVRENTKDYNALVVFQRLITKEPLRGPEEFYQSIKTYKGGYFVEHKEY